MTTTIKYCGGCNPTFDRVAFCDKLFEAFPALTAVSGGENAGLALVICGCSRGCAEHSHIDGAKGKFVVCANNDYDRLCKWIVQMLSEKGAK